MKRREPLCIGSEERIAHPGNQPKTITGGFMFARLRYLLDFTAWALTIAFVPFLGVVIYLAGGGR